MRIFSDDFQSLRLTPVQKLIYVFLSSISDEDGFISISTNDISNRVGCSRVSVSNSLSYLDSISLVRVYRGSSIGDLNSYSVLDPFKESYREIPKVQIKETVSDYEERMNKARELALKGVEEFRKRGTKEEEVRQFSAISPNSKSPQSKRMKNRIKRKNKGKK